MSNKNDFEFDMGDTVHIKVSGEQGQVIGRADYKHDQNYFQIRYRTSNGTATTRWWGADALLKIPDPS